MLLIFSDGTKTFQGTLNFGESAVKTFKIENRGSLDANAKINWLNLTK